MTAFLGWLRVTLMITGATAAALAANHIAIMLVIVAVTVAAMIGLFELAESF